MDNEKQHVLVAGANGKTGRIVIERLKTSDKYAPIAMIRKQSQKEYFENQNVSTILADLEDNLDSTVKNAEKIIFAAGSGGEKVKEVDQEGAKRLTDAAKNAGIKKFVMLSSMGADNPAAIAQLQDYLKAKQKADEYLKNSGLNYTIVRPGGLTNEKGTGKIDTHPQLTNSASIARADVAHTLVEVLEDDVKQNQTFEFITGEEAIEKAVRS